MKSLVSVFLTSLFVVFLTACFGTRTDLFYLSVEETTYSISSDETLPELFGYQIESIELEFTDLNQTVNDDYTYEKNEFGDFSYSDIKLYQIKLMMQLNGTSAFEVNLEFGGNANPGRKNAYKFTANIPQLYHETSEYRIVLELNSNTGGNFNKLGYILIQFINNKSSEYNHIYNLRNEIENQRNKSLNNLDNLFYNFKRIDYTQENWSLLFSIEKDARSAINQAETKEEILQLFSKAVSDLNAVPKIN